MKRVLTALVLIPLALAAVLWAPPALVFCVVALVAGLCFLEYRAIVAAYGYPAPGLWTLAAGLTVLAARGDGLLLAAALALIASALAMRDADLSKALPAASAELFGIIYVFGSWRCALRLHEVSPYWLLFALVLNWIGDAAAYYAGRAIGRHKLAPHVSPNKTWEGAAASAISAAVFALLYFPRALPQVPPGTAIALAVAINAIGQLGDLAESALKRGAGVKDSGSLLPGHGGMLDRVDSSMFAIPAVYAWVQLSAWLS